MTLSLVSMPWWGWGYLLFVLTMFVASFMTETPRNQHEIIGSTLSLFTICTFVVGFFNLYVVDFLGVMLLPMFAVGVYWEFTRSISETKRAQDMLVGERDLSDEERAFLLNFAMVFNAIIIVPGYVMGLVLCTEFIGGFGNA